ncbi:MAG: phytoene desaturase [Gammaproteobacteria bacterium]|nr:phytoene desaturase [Gammaproteobacteria bacterium]
MRSTEVVVVGAGVGGLSAAMLLAARGIPVRVIEARDEVGGKLRQVRVGDTGIDAGPTVMTMRWVFDELFQRCGLDLDDRLVLTRAERIARHAWCDGASLDLYSDEQRSADSIGRLSGAAEARGFLAFSRRAREIYQTLECTFLRAPKPSPFSLTANTIRTQGLRGVNGILRIAPYATLWSALGRYFRDTRLRQLFGRYATYCGSSPFQCPATLMLVAHVEHQGVWLVEGDMQQLALTLARSATELGARIELGRRVSRIELRGGRIGGIRTDDDQWHRADAVICNADAAAIAAGCLGDGIRACVPPVTAARRSLSAVTWNLHARTRGFPLLRHNVFFSDDYRAEFESIFEHRQLPRQPTVYVCAQDREQCQEPTSSDRERLLCLVNAPAIGSSGPMCAAELDACARAAFGTLTRCGLQIEHEDNHSHVTTPYEFSRLFPGTNGALYGAVSHGWQGSFRRPDTKTRIPGLYLAGGSTHPGPGVPMAALSGVMAAQHLLAEL